MKYWQLLLTKQRERGKAGLTLPFIIGSQNYLPETHFNQTIAELIKDVTISQTFETCIRYCMGTQTFILEIRRSKNSVYYPKYKNSEQTNLSVGTFAKGDFGESIDTVIDFLYDSFQDKIESGLYSAVPNEYERKPTWKPFSLEDDIPFIQNSFKFL